MRAVEIFLGPDHMAIRIILSVTFTFPFNQFNIDHDKTSTDTQNVINKKILTTFRKLEKTFTEESDPVFLDENGKKLTMKEIHNKECVGDKPITMIAVSRHQYDVANFPKYINYIKNTLKKNTIYYGLYHDEKVEWDVLYAIPTNDYDEIQKHLNAHDHMNNDVSQIMGLTISQDGKSKATKNAEKAKTEKRVPLGN